LNGGRQWCWIDHRIKTIRRYLVVEHRCALRAGLLWDP
jgi:hypothetical protein